MEAAEILTAAYGMDWNFVKGGLKDSAGNKANAQFAYKNGRVTITVDITAKLNGKSLAIFAMSHELTHFIKDWSLTKFNTLAEFLIRKYGEIGEGETAEYLINKRMESGLTHDEALEEFVAECCERFLLDGNALQNASELAKSDPNLFKRFIAKIKEWIGKIRAAFAGHEAQSRESAITQTLDALEQIRALWEEALEDAGRNYRAAQGLANKNGTRYEITEEQIANNAQREAENINNGKAAVDELIHLAKVSNDPESLEIKNAMYRAELGYIDLKWGTPGKGSSFKKGYGISHIIAKRGAEGADGVLSAYKVIETIAKAKIGDIQQNDQVNQDVMRVRLYHDGNAAVLSKNPGQNHWLLTGWDNKEATTSAIGEVHDSTDATAATPIRTRRSGDAIASNDMVQQENKYVNPKNKKTRSQTTVTAEEETRYLELAKDPTKNEAELSRMVAEAAKRAGYISPILYHGTTKFGFTVFSNEFSDDKLSFFVTESADMAQTYSGKRGVQRLGKLPFKNIEKLSGEEIATLYRTYVDLYDEEKPIFIAPDDEGARVKMVTDAVDTFLGYSEITKYIDELDSAGAYYKAYLQDRIEAFKNNPNYLTAEQLYKAVEGVYAASQYAFYVDDPGDIFSDLRGPVLSAIALFNDAIAKKSGAMTYLFSGMLTGKKHRFCVDLPTFINLKARPTLREGNYALVGKPGNQLVIDANGSTWDAISIDDYLDTPFGEALKKDFGEDFFDYQKQTINTRQISEYAYKAGYDSVSIQNIFDDGGKGVRADKGTVQIYFNPSRLKSADPVTYDDDGNVIPLSERFNEEKSDIRYQVAVDKRGKSSYNEYRTLAMQWANATNRVAGEKIILFDGRRGSYFLIEASDDADMGYIELSNGTLKQMREEKEWYDTSRSEVDRWAESDWVRQGYNDGDRFNPRNTGEYAEDDRLPSRGMGERSQETNGAGSVETTQENRSTRSQLTVTPEESGSVRSTLASALASVATSEKDRAALKSYQAMVRSLDRNQAQLEKTGGVICDLFGLLDRANIIEKALAFASAFCAYGVQKDELTFLTDGFGPLKKLSEISRLRSMRYFPLARKEILLLRGSDILFAFKLREAQYTRCKPNITAKQYKNLPCGQNFLLDALVLTRHRRIELKKPRLSTRLFLAKDCYFNKKIRSVTFRNAADFLLLLRSRIALQTSYPERCRESAPTWR